LLKHLVKELPFLQKEMAEKLKPTVAAIKKLGDKRETFEEQRAVLTQVSMELHDIIKCAIRGHYVGAFFDPIHTDLAVGGPQKIRRLRAAIQHLNITFAKNMRLRRHKYSIGTGPGDSKQAVAEDEMARRELQGKSEDGMPDSPGLLIPKHLTRDAGIRWVQQLLERTRGTELPSTYQPALIAQLFQEMCEPWKGIATTHLQKIHRTCMKFVRMVVRDSAPEEFYSPLASLDLDHVFNKARSGEKTELNKLFQDLELDPSTYNHYSTTTLQKIRQQKY